MPQINPIEILAGLVGCMVIIAAFVKRRGLDGPTRNAVISSAFGLFVISRLAKFEHGGDAILFQIGVGLLMTASAIGLLRRASSKD